MLFVQERVRNVFLSNQDICFIPTSISIFVIRFQFLKLLLKDHCDASSSMNFLTSLRDELRPWIQETILIFFWIDFFEEILAFILSI
jgi:hypothetical protein